MAFWTASTTRSWSTPASPGAEALASAGLSGRPREAGHEVTVAWERPLEAAQKHPLSAETFREQFGRLGDTPFELIAVTGLEEPSSAMVPKSVFFFQAEDGIRDLTVTGVQTCALPI